MCCDLACCPRFSDRFVVQDIVCAINVQHDCFASDCHKKASKPVFQERLKTLRTREIVDHESTNAYILNTLSIHNYQHILAALPEGLINRKSLLSDAEALAVRQNAVLAMAQKKKSTRNDDTTTPTPSTSSGPTPSSSVLPAPALSAAAALHPLAQRSRSRAQPFLR